MADKATKRETLIKNKIGPKDLGNAKKIFADDKADAKLLLGTIIGQANGVKSGYDERSGRPWFGLKGSFMAIPADDTQPRVRSGVCFLPSGMAELVAGAMETIDGVQSGNVQFGFSISVIKDASSGVGYKYECMPLIDATETDPLEQLVAQVSSGKQPQIEDKSKARGKAA